MEGGGGGVKFSVDSYQEIRLRSLSSSEVVSQTASLSASCWHWSLSFVMVLPPLSAVMNALPNSSCISCTWAQEGHRLTVTFASQGLLTFCLQIVLLFHLHCLLSVIAFLLYHVPSDHNLELSHSAGGGRGGVRHARSCVWVHLKLHASDRSGPQSMKMYAIINL